MNKPIKITMQTPKIELQAKAGLEIIQYGTLTLGTTTTLAAGQEATVTNSGSAENAILNFGIPKGQDGQDGEQGPQGVPGADGKDGEQGPQGIPGKDGRDGEQGPQGEPGIGIKYKDDVETYAQLPTAGNIVGDAYYINADGLLYIYGETGFPDNGDGIQYRGPQGPQGVPGIDGKDGEQGLQGIPGIPGTAATIEIGTVATGKPGSNASVTNTGTATAAVFDITIPSGKNGTDGKSVTKTSELENDSGFITEVAVNEVLERFIPITKVGNSAEKIPVYNSDGHLVLPDGSEFWIG